MQYDRDIKISHAGVRTAAIWNTRALMWSEFVTLVSIPVIGTETFEEYSNLSKALRDAKKDVGGFVGGVLRGGKRSIKNVVCRDIITLDLDKIPAGGTNSVLLAVGSLGCAATVYSTRNHTSFAPRLRVCIPLDRSALSEECEPVARKLAGLIGIEMCDPTCFDICHIMYYPSICRDAEFVNKTFDQPFVSVDGVLAMYTNWRDSSEWCRVPDEHTSNYLRERKKQEDPLAKRGIVGAFCREYTVLEAMDIYLPGVYIPCDDSDKYTYALGSTAGGVLIHDDGAFMYSYHSTDPTSRILCNAFDLVRRHKFEGLDDDKSNEQMRVLALSDQRVAARFNLEKLQEAGVEFADENEAEEMQKLFAKLKRTDTGAVKKTISNIYTILSFDPKLKGIFSFDEFAHKSVIIKRPPWINKEKFNSRDWVDLDWGGLKMYLENYAQFAQSMVMDAFGVLFSNNSINPLEEYLESLYWDGVPRLDTFFSDYLGAEDCHYTHRVSRLWFVGAIRRALNPGSQFDLMPILSGKQGDGKSEIIRRLGRPWVQENMPSFEGQKACEAIQGKWIVEIAELHSMSKSTVEAVKAFMTVKEDYYRPPYARTAANFPRSCVFVGTTNKLDYLTDRTGNRRFVPLDLGVQPEKYNYDTHLVRGVVDQIWAEALVLYHRGEKSYINKYDEDYQLFFDKQEEHREVGIWEDMIKEFVNRDVPENWGEIKINERMNFWQGTWVDNPTLVPRGTISSAEIWVECFGQNLAHCKQSDTREINSILSSLEGWERRKSRHAIGEYGNPRGQFIRSGLPPLPNHS